MIESFISLSEKEVLRFDKFINSPYFNSNKNAVRLFTYLKSKYPNIGENDLEKKKVYAAVYSMKRVDEVKYRKLISDFSKLFENFLMQCEFEEDFPRNRMYLLKSLRRREMSKRFEMNYKEVSGLQKKRFSKDDKHYYGELNLESEFFYFNYSRFQTEFAKCLGDLNDSLDHFFLFEKLHCFHEMIMNEINVNKKLSFDKTFLNEIILYFRKNENDISKNHPNLFIIYNVVQMYLNPDEKYLDRLLSYLKKHERKFSSDKLCHYYNYLIEFHVLQINKGRVEYRNSAFKIFKIMFERDLFLLENKMTDISFNNVINLTLPLKEYHWIEQFIEKYKTNLSDLHSKDAYNLAMARLNFEKRDYDKVFPLLNDVEFKNPFYYINAKFILARIYFDLKNFNSLPYIINNLQQYIREKTSLLEKYKASTQTFLKYLIQLVKIMDLNKTERKAELIIFKKNLDDDSQFVPNKKWFYEKTWELT